MILNIGTKWRIRSDAYQWTVEKLGGKLKDKKTGEESDLWRPISHHTQLETAIRRMVDHRLMTAEVEGLQAAIAVLHKVAKEIGDAINIEIRIPDMKTIARCADARPLVLDNKPIMATKVTTNGNPTKPKGKKTKTRRRVRVVE